MTQGKENKKMIGPRGWLAFGVSVFLIYNAALFYALTSFAQKSEVNEAKAIAEKNDKAILKYTDSQINALKGQLSSINSAVQLTNSRVWEIYKAVKK